jgi:hypothetical protein
MKKEDEDVADSPAAPTPRYGPKPNSWRTKIPNFSFVKARNARFNFEG